MFSQNSQSLVDIQPGHDKHPHSYVNDVHFAAFLDLEGGKFFFNTVKEGDSVLFATEDEQVSVINYEGLLNPVTHEGYY